jgi:hypothetical protein
MNDEPIVIQLLLQNSPIWVAFMLGFVPALVAGVKQRPKTRWYLYGLLCALVAWATPVWRSLVNSEIKPKASGLVRLCGWNVRDANFVT